MTCGILPIFILPSVPAKTILILYYSQTLQKEFYLEASLMHVVTLMDMYNISYLSSSDHFVLYKAIRRGCESV